MVALPGSPTVDAIYEHYKNRKESPRKYLGGSRIGEECRRMLWLEFRQAGRPDFPGRILRLFETGNVEEARVIRNLRSIGVRVEDKDENGKQFGVSAVDGHLKGHMDGVLLGLLEAPKTWHLFEGKTANKKQFAEFVRLGLKKWKPVYYGQCQIYMHLAKLKRTAFFVTCKDDDQIEVERIEYNKEEAEALLRKAASIIYTDEAPDRIGRDASFYKCKWCDMSAMCWGKVFPLVGCRTCAHARPVPGGDAKWECGRDLPMDPGCAEHIYLPSLLHWLTPVDGDETYVEYEEGLINAAASAFPGRDKETRSSRDLWLSTEALPK